MEFVYIDRWVLLTGLGFLVAAVGGILWGFSEMLWPQGWGEAGMWLAAIGGLVAAGCGARLGDRLRVAYGYEGLAELGLGAFTLLALGPVAMVALLVGDDLGLALLMLFGGLVLLLAGAAALLWYIVQIARAAGRPASTHVAVAAVAVLGAGILLLLLLGDSQWDRLPGLFIAGLPSLLLVGVLWDIWLWGEWEDQASGPSVRPAGN